MENIRWKTVLLFLASAYLIAHLPFIIETLSVILTNSVEAINHVLGGIINPRRYRGSSSHSINSLAELCALLIALVGIIKILKK